MKVAKIDNTNFSARNRAINRTARVVVPAVTMAAVGDMYVRSKRSNYLSDFFDRVVENFQQIVIDDNESFDNYYHIDLNLANSKTFRDRELFNPLLDFEESTDYSQYNNDDELQVISHNKALDQNFYGYKLSETDIDQEDIGSIPVLKEREKQEDRTEDLIDIKSFSYYKQQNVNNLCRPITENKYVGKHLKYLTIKLIMNKEAKLIPDSELINDDIREIVNSVNNKNEALSIILYKLAIDMLNNNYSNKEIKNYIQAYMSMYDLGLVGAMKYYNPEIDKFDTKQMRKDGRFDLYRSIR